MITTDGSNTNMQEDGQGKAKASNPGFKKYLVYFLVFWAIVIVIALLVRYLVIAGLLLGGSNDRSLLAVVSAVIEGDSLTVTFIHSVPDEPTELFILSGACPQFISSDAKKENTIKTDEVVFNGVPFEILHRANCVDKTPPGASSAVEYKISWASREQGEIKLGPLGDSLVGHIKSNKAFLLVSNGEGTFAAAAISY